MDHSAQNRRSPIQPQVECLAVSNLAVGRWAVIPPILSQILAECPVGNSRVADHSSPNRIHLQVAILDSRPAVRRPVASHPVVNHPAVNHRVACRDNRLAVRHRVVNHLAVSHREANLDSYRQAESLASWSHRASSNHCRAHPNNHLNCRRQRGHWRPKHTRAEPRRNLPHQSCRAIAFAVRRSIRLRPCSTRRSCHPDFALPARRDSYRYCRQHPESRRHSCLPNHQALAIPNYRHHLHLPWVCRHDHHVASESAFRESSVCSPQGSNFRCSSWELRLPESPRPNARRSLAA